MGQKTIPSRNKTLKWTETGGGSRRGDDAASGERVFGVARDLGRALETGSMPKERVRCYPVELVRLKPVAISDSILLGIGRDGRGPFRRIPRNHDHGTPWRNEVC